VSNSELATGLFIVAFLLQIAGVVLVVLEIRNDLHTARDIEAREEGPRPTGVGEVTPTGGTFIGGSLGAHLAGTMQGTDTFRTFIAERLSGGLKRRVLGVGLFVAGAAIDLSANLISL
jgi:hypothetical protein